MKQGRDLTDNEGVKQGSFRSSGQVFKEKRVVSNIRSREFKKGMMRSMHVSVNVSQRVKNS